jgi:hypothetical protein
LAAATATMAAAAHAAPILLAVYWLGVPVQQENAALESFALLLSD